MTGEQRRSVVIDAAIAEFAVYGLYGVSTDAIADRVGVSQPYVIRLFGSKKSLFLEAGRRVFERILAAFEDEVGKDPEDALSAVQRAYVGLLARREELLMLLQFFAACEDDEVRQAVHEGMERLYGYIKERTGADSETIRELFTLAIMRTVSVGAGFSEAARESEWARVLLGLGAESTEEDIRF
ncbi:TetR/AcrR family transcriptional regulator [Rubrobacter calidifluminis]|uniref:TetR/AcrR family transcriptional regulator n=1 Tax=Rubrobacter calidifluminis TaxID=1392640 RepID=UPI00235DF423|nr:TetR/AcrR family transcriptional regulator [Rubrobacter calidifluminis]